MIFRHPSWLLGGAVLVASTLASGASSKAKVAPAVVADIAPVHSLVARVMDGVGMPSLILPPGASPHSYSMKPSEARALQSADVVFWVGPSLTPWFGNASESLTPAAAVIPLMESDGVTLLPFRESATFEKHDHAHGEGHGHSDAHAHEDEHAHKDEHAGEDKHAHEDEHGDVHKEAHGHAEGAIDPHLWLDPENAKVWLDAIARALADADPANGNAYLANAAAGSDELDALTERLDADLAAVRGRPFVVFHDAYHYFEARFEVKAAGAVALSDASDPGPARVAEIRQLVADTAALCVFSEPQFEPKLVATVIEGTDARSAVLDPIGAELTPGPGLYPALLENLKDQLIVCLD